MYHQRPCDVFGLDDPWVRWQFDRAVFWLGNTVEAKYEERYDTGKRKGERKWTLEQILSGYAMKRKGGIINLFLASGSNVMDI